MGVMWERVAERRAGIVVTPDGRVFSESLLLRTLRLIRAEIFNQDFRAYARSRRPLIVSGIDATDAEWKRALDT